MEIDNLLETPERENDKPLVAKSMLTTKEAAKYMDIKISYLHKLTMNRQIPYFKPFGKKCYFLRADLDQLLQSNRVATNTELNTKAQAYCMQKGGKR